jgi:hypothetical protein
VAAVDGLSTAPGFPGNPWVDGRPRTFTSAEIARLTDLAGVLVAVFQRRRQADEMARRATR